MSLHHHNSPSAALSEAYRVVRPSGKIFIIEPAESSELMKVCAPFDLEESTRLQQAIAALHEHTIQESHNIYPVWWFADVSELHTWLSEYYASTSSVENHALADEGIAAKRDNSPLYVQDELRVMVLPVLK